MILNLHKLALCAIFSVCSLLVPQGLMAQSCNPNDATASSGFCAPQLNTSNSNYTWSQSVNQSNGSANVFRLISSGKLTHTVPTSTYPAAFNGPIMIDINDVISYDGYASRGSVNQTNERWRVVFKKNGTVLFRSNYTNDVPDHQVQGFWRGSLNTGIYFANGFDEIVFEHIDFAQGYAGPGSVIPTGLAMNYYSPNPLVCAKVSMEDQAVCAGSSIALSPVIDLAGDAEQAVDSQGFVDNLSRVLGESDGSGAYFCRGTSGTYTRGVWRMPCNLPSGTQVCIRVKVNSSGTAHYGIYGGDNSILNPASGAYTLISTQNHGGNTYQDICVTLPADYRYIKIQDNGGAPFLVDNISYQVNCTPTYLWSTGATTASIDVSPTVGTSYSVATTVCGTTYNNTIHVSVKPCYPVSCTRTVGNTRGCAASPYVLWLKDKNNIAHRLSGDSTLYTWTQYANGDARFTASSLTAPGLAGTYDADILFTGFTNSPPVNSPKLSGCFSSTGTGWSYWTGTSGTVTSSAYGDINVSKTGPSMQIGHGANITQDGFGASGWLTTGGGSGEFIAGDINVMLSDCGVIPPTPVSCATGDYKWENNVTITNNNVSAGVRFIDGQITRFKLPNLPAEFNQAVRVTVGEVVSWDGYSGRQNVTQPNETWKIVFFKDGNIVYETPYTNDVQDNAVSGEWIGSLGVATTLTAGADSVLLVHYEDPTNGTGSASTANSVVPVGVCISYETIANVIEGTVWNDNNNNQTQDGSESGRPNVEVCLYDDANGNGTIDAAESTALQCVETDANGNYTFDVIYSGGTENYLIATNTSDYPGEFEFTNDNIEAVTFTSGGNTESDNDFGYIEPNTISGSLFLDANVDGDLDGSEPLVDGVTVYLFEDTNGNGIIDAAESTPIDSTVSDASGFYDFSVYYSGNGTDDYLVSPDTSDLPTGNYLTTNDPLPASFTSSVQTDVENDFGYNLPNTIEGLVFNDVNGNGVFDAGDIVFPGVTVFLYDDANNNAILDAAETTPIDSTVTNASGEYMFVQRYTGGTNSFIMESDTNTYPAGAFITTANQETASFTSGDNVDDDNEFGFDASNRISGTVFNDYNANGTQDAGEPGESGITVFLYEDQNSNGTLDPFELATPVDSTVTNGNGDYSFGVDYIPGTTDVFFTGTDLEDYPTQSSLTTDNEEDATFSAGDLVDAENNFGFRETNTIRGTVYSDFDGDAVEDAGEPGESGITVYLFEDTNNNGVIDAGEDTPIDSAITDANGDYEFTQPYTGGTNSYITSTDLDDYPVGTNLTTDNLETSEFTSGDNIEEDNDFGFRGDNTITGTVFNDYNKNEVQEGTEPGEQFITVNLYEDSNDNGILDAGETTPIATTSTDLDGFYSFTQPYTGGTNSFIVQTVLGDYPSQASLTTDNLEVASFTSSNNTDPNNDFGFSETNQITGIVYKDADTDQVLDAGEQRQSSVTVNLFEDTNDNGILDAGETTPVQSTTTDANGAYSFDVDYTGGTNSFIVSTDESSYPARTYLTTDNEEVASFTSGSNIDPDNNFGFNDNNEISGTVFEDSDKDGFNDLAEDGTFNVLVLLYNDANNNGVLDASENTIIDSVRTDASGNYLFEVPYTGGTNSFITAVDTTTLPKNSSLTTDNIETASFTSGGNADPNNDFGHDGCSTNTGLVGPDNGCALEDQVFAASPAVSGATYTWTFTGNPTISTAAGEATQIAQWNASGVNDVELIVAIPGCVDTFSKSINITRAVFASAAPGDTICDGRNTVLDGTASSTGVNFNWTVESGDPFSIDVGDMTSQPTVSPAITTVYKMTVTDQLNGCSRVEFVTVFVDVNRNPTAVIAPLDAVCEGEVLALDGSGSVAPVTNASGTVFHYWFRDGAAFASFTDMTSTTIDTTTDIRLIVFDAVSLCPDTAEVTVVPVMKPVVGLDKVNPTCQLDNGQLVLEITNNPTRTSVKFSIDGGVTYPFTTNDNVGTFTISDLAADFYNVYAVWSNDDCPVELGTIELEDTTVIPTVNADFSINGGTFNTGDSVSLEGLDILDLQANSNGEGTYAWTGPNGFGERTQAINVTTAAQFADTGDYYVLYTNEDGCFTVDSINVDVRLFNTISGTVYKDANGDNDQQVMEAGRDGVRVYLYEDTNGNGVLDAGETTPLATDVTDIEGDYDFKVEYFGGIDNLLVRTERADFPAGVAFTEEEDNQKEIVFNAGNGDSPENDFGFVPSMSIGSTIFLDDDKDGTLNGTETGIEGVIVRAFADADENGEPDDMNVLSQDTTDGSGNYYLGGLIPGKYVVVISADQFEAGEALESFPTSSTGNGTDNGVDGDDNGIQAASGEEVTSPTITLTEGAEPDTESGLGSGQEITNGTINENGDMTIDFGFNCASEVAVSVRSSKAVIISENDPITLTFNVVNSGEEPLANPAISAKSSRDAGITQNNLSAPVFVSGDANTNSILEPGETWVYTLANQTFTYDRGDRIQVHAYVDAEGCETVTDTTDITIRTFGTNMDVIMPEGCVVPGDTIQVDLITRLLIDEDFEKAPTSASGNPIERIQYNAYLEEFTVTGVNGGASFDPFNPPAGVNISYFQSQGADAGRITGNVLDECEPVNTVKLPCTGNQDVNCEFPEWVFTIDVVVPNITNLDSFVVVAEDVFDVDLLLETGVGTGTFVALTSLNDQSAVDSGVADRCDQDFGDLDDRYGATSSADAAYHIIVPELFLGAGIDEEFIGTGSAGADGDDNSGIDDEDGWKNDLDTLFVNDTASVEFDVVNLTGRDAYLTLFIDADDNGTFDADEIVVDTVPSQFGTQTRFISYPVPADVINGRINMRARLTTLAGIGATGDAPDGEVEDYGSVIAVPVDLVSITAEIVQENDVLVQWTTASELNNRGFEVERRMEGEAEFTYLDFVEGNGTTTATTKYNYLDEQVQWNSNIAYYRLRQIDFDGKYVYSPIVVVTKKGAVDAIVYPNPTKTSATISIVSDAKNITSTIKVIDMFGAEVTGEVDVQKVNGAYTVDARALRNGTYFIELSINNQKVVKKLMVTR